MKVKIGTQMEDKIFRKLKVRAAEVKRPIADIIQEAVSLYLREEPKGEERQRNTLRLLDNPIHLSDKKFKEVLTLDYYDQ